MKNITKIVNIQVFIILQLLALISYSNGSSLPKPSVLYRNNNLATQSYTSNFVYMSMGNKAPVRMCTLDESGNQFNNCQNVSWTLDYPTSVTIHPLHKYLYTVNKETGLIAACPLNLTTGDFYMCNISWYDFKSPSSLAFSPDGKLAYITDYMKNGSVWFCLISESTMLPTNCKPTGFGFNAPSSIIIDPTGNYAYISDYKNNTVVMCSVVKPSGSLNNCIVYKADLLDPIGFTFIDNSYLYIANTINVESAMINSNGSLTFFNKFYGFNNLGGLASYLGNLYIADSGTGIVSICKLNNINKSIESCHIADTNKNWISGITILSN